MTISDAGIGRFRELWKFHFGKEITEAEAQEYGDRLIRVVKTMLDPQLHQRERGPP